MNAVFTTHLAVVPILVGPFQVLLAILPAILLGIGSALLALFKPATFKLALRLLWRVKVSALIAVGLISGTVFAARALWRSANGAVGKAESGAHEWPLFRGNTQRTGAVTSGTWPITGGINWAFASEARTFHSSPTIVGNRLYATSAEVGVFSNRGAIYCLDADTGGVVWKSVPEGFRATFSSPSISGKYLITGEWLHQTHDGRIICLDVTRGGALLWSYRTKSHVESSAAIADGRAYIGAGDDGYYCFKLEPDAAGKPVMVWHLPTEKYPDAETDPVVHEGRVYFGLGIGGHAIVCVDSESGRELWRASTPSPVFTPPTIARGKIFIGMGHGNFVETEEQVIAAELDRLRASGKNAGEIEEAKKNLQTGGEAWCIDIATQKVDWRIKTDSTVLGPVVAAADRVFFASRGGTVYSVGFDGKQIANWNARAPIIASLAVTASHVYTVTESGRLFALEQAGMQPVWEAGLGASGSFLSSPAIARGHVYVGSPEDGLLCVGQPAGQTLPRIWAGHLGGPGAGGNPENVVLPVNADFICSWPKAGDAAETITAPAAVANNRLFVPLDGIARKGVVCLKPDERSHEAPAEQWFCPTTNGVTTSPAAAQSGIVFSDGAVGMTSRRLHFVNASSGVENWSAEIERNAFGFACLTPDAVLAEDHTGSLTSFDLHGRLRWRRSLLTPATEPNREQLAGPPAVTDALIIATTAGALVALDELEGTILWHAVLTDAPATGPVIRRNSVIFGTAKGISAHRITDGKPLWHAPVGPVKSALVHCGDFVAATTSAGEIVLLDSETGQIRTRQAGATADIPPLPAHDALLFAAPDGVMRLRLADKTVGHWLSRNTEDVITSPLIVCGSSAYFASGKRGLIRAGKSTP